MDQTLPQKVRSPVILSHIKDANWMLIVIGSKGKLAQNTGKGRAEKTGTKCVEIKKRKV